MSRAWTDSDEYEWQRLNRMSYTERSVEEELKYKHLEAKRELAVMRKSEQIRKRGPFYTAAIVVFLAGLGSCGVGAAGAGGGAFGLGVALVMLSSLLNWANSKVTGVD